MHPKPESQPALFMGGMSPAAIERAARLGDGFLATLDEHIGIYVDALARVGKDPAAGRIVAGKWAVIAEDPEREWAHVGENVLYQINDYVRYNALGPEIAPLKTPQDVLDSGLYALWDGATAVSEFVRMAREFPQIEQFKVWTLMPGEPVDGATKRLEYFAETVTPEVNRQLLL